MKPPRVLVAGVGNVLLGDDGFGVEVVRLLQAEALPDNVRVVDYGIRAVHLAYDLLDGYDTLVIVDAMSRGRHPGTTFVFEPDLTGTDEGVSVDPHGLHPAAVVRMALELGARIGTVRVVGCEPADVDEGIGLSEPVAGALGAAVALVQQLVEVATRITRKENGHVEEAEDVSG